MFFFERYMIQANILIVFSLNFQGTKKKVLVKEDLSPYPGNTVNCCQKTRIFIFFLEFSTKIKFQSPVFKENEWAFSFVLLNEHFILITSGLFLEHLTRISLSVAIL